jgi:elongation factor 1-beta
VEKSLYGVARNAACSGAPTDASSVDTRAHKSAIGWKILAKVLASIKILPNDANIDLNALKTRIQKSLPAGFSVQKFEEEPIAFGLVALVALFVIPEDAAGQMDRLEEAVKGVDQVSQIEVLRVGRF